MVEILEIDEADEMRGIVGEMWRLNSHLRKDV